MPVNVAALDTLTLHPIAGVQLGIASAGVKTVGKKDVTLITCDEGTSVAGVFTQNRFCAAPVLICRKQLAAGHSIRALVINTGNANAGTGEQGLRDAQLVCQATAELLGVSAEQVLPFSTGVILQPLPADKIVAALPQAKADLAEDRWLQAAPAIMTTDIVPKAASCQIQLDGKTISITGISKGSGMIHPNMATMLGYVATDAAVAPDVLQQLLSDVADRSFNCVTVDGDTSTNDSFILLASGKAQNTVIDSVEHPDYATLRQAILTISQTLAQAIARDGEGATKFITVNVEGANNWQEGKTIAYAIAKSPLVKTAMFASDPNLGRILAAVGYAGIDDLDVAKLEIWLGDVLVAQHGGVAASYSEEQGQRVMNEAEITITVKLNRGCVDTFVWTCDFSYDYVRINADYRS